MTTLGAVAVVALSAGRARGREASLNTHVLAAVRELNQAFGGKGYSAGAYYTHDVRYGAADVVKASKHRPRTMCVAGVAEVLATAIDVYSRASGDVSVFRKLPVRTWVKSTRRDLRPYLFMYKSVESNGTADALQQFGVGEQVPFKDLQPGDFVNFNRTNRTGHAVVFLGFIDARGEPIGKYERHKVSGFQYFSAQGPGTQGGFGYRWAFFHGKCPKKRIPGKLRDCGLIFRNDQRILNTGYLLHPGLWTDATDTRETAVRMRLLAAELKREPRIMDFRQLRPSERARLDDRVREFLSVDLPEADMRAEYDGITID